VQRWGYLGSSPILEASSPDTSRDTINLVLWAKRSLGRRSCGLPVGAGGQHPRLHADEFEGAVVRQERGTLQLRWDLDIIDLGGMCTLPNVTRGLTISRGLLG
jgi:hypothetical protein